MSTFCCLAVLLGIQIGVGLHANGELAPREIHVLQQLMEHFRCPLVQLKLQPDLPCDPLKLLPGLFVDVRPAQDSESAPRSRKVDDTLHTILVFIVT